MIMFTSIRRALRDRAKRRQTINELNQLSNRELSDLGISRCDIYRIAHEATSR